MTALKQFLTWRMEWLVSYKASPEWLRVAVLRRLGMPVGEDVQIKAGTRFLKYQSTIADGVFISGFCYFEDHAPVRLGANVWVAAHCRFYTATHEVGPPQLRAGPWFAEPISVGAGTWIGGNVTVLPGVSIGPGCVIAAGSVVNGDCTPNGLYAGVPAVRKRDLPS